MKVYVLMIIRSTFKNWETQVEAEQAQGWRLKRDAMFKKFNDIVVFIIPRDFDIPPEEILGALQPEKVVIIYSSKHQGQIRDCWKQPASQIYRTYPMDSQDVSYYAEQAFRKNDITWTNKLDPLIVICTLRYSDVDYPEWHKAVESGKAQFYDDGLNPLKGNCNKIRVAKFKVDNFIVLFVKENNYGISRNNPLDSFLNQILQSNRWRNIPEKYIAVHDLNSYIENASQFEDRVKYICDFHHIDADPDKSFCDSLLNFLQNVEKDEIRKAKRTCQRMIELIRRLSLRLVERFSILKHRIAHLFLPLDIDLMGIKEVLSSKLGSSEENKSRAVDYLKDVLESKNGDTRYYRQKLAKLQYVVAGEYVDFPQANGNIKEGKIKECDPVKPKDAANLLADNKSIYELILDSDKIIGSTDWQTLTRLSGLKLKDGVNEKNPDTNCKVYEPDKNSRILQFMCLMDCKIQKLQSIGENDVNELTSKLESFHSWFCALHETLDKIGG